MVWAIANASNDLYRSRSQSNGIIAKFVLLYLDLIFRGRKFKKSTSQTVLELSIKMRLMTSTEIDTNFAVVWLHFDCCTLQPLPSISRTYIFLLCTFYKKIVPTTDVPGRFARRAWPRRRRVVLPWYCIFYMFSISCNFKLAPIPSIP